MSFTWEPMFMPQGWSAQSLLQGRREGAAHDRKPTSLGANYVQLHKKA